MTGRGAAPGPGGDAGDGVDCGDSAAPGPGVDGDDLTPLPPGDELYGVPSAAQLLDAVRGFLEEEVRSETTGRTRFLARVSANVLATVARQLAAGPADRPVHLAQLESLGLADERALAAAVRAGGFDGRTGELRRILTATVAARLAVSNPRYLTG